MPMLNLIQEPVYLETDLDEIQIRNLILNNKHQLGLVDFDERRTPLSHVMILDGLDADAAYRVCVVARDKNVYREVDITACGSGAMDVIKARIFRDSVPVFSMESSRYVRNLLFALIRRAEEKQEEKP